MNKGTIFYIGFFGMPDKDAAAIRVMNNAKAIRACGYEVIFIDEQDVFPYENTIVSKREMEGFTVYSQKRPLSVRGYLNKMMSIEVIKDVIQQHKNVKMIIAYNFPAIPMIKLCCYLDKKIALVSDCTEWYSGKEYSFPMNILCSLDSSLRMRVINKHITGVICISQYLYEYYNDKGINIKVPPLIDDGEEIWKQKIRTFDFGILNLVYSGNPGKYKDKLQPVVHAVYRSPNRKRIKLRIVGITYEQYIDNFPEDVDIIGSCSGCIEFIGRVSHRESINIIQSSDYLVFMRDQNRVSAAGFSTKFVEAISSGTKVITTDTGELREYIGKYDLGKIIYNEGELEYLLDSKFDELIQNKKCNFTCDIFSYSNYVEQFNCWLKKVLE